MSSQKEEKTKGIVTGRVGEAAAGPGGKNYLLVIGIDEYAYCPPLYNCVKDAQEVIELLSSEYPFSIDYDEFPPLFNTQATKENITDAFRRLAMKVTQEDNVLIYFSGHGHYDKVFQQGYWVPVEAAEEKITGYIPNSEVRVFLNAIKSRHTFLMADSCFSGALFMDKSAGKIISRRSERDPSRWGLTSGRNEIVSDGEPGKNSPFAESLLYRLRNNTGHLGVDELCAHVKEHVEANSNQTPIGEPLKVEGHKNGLFVFHRLPKETNDWERALSLNTPEAYAQFLEKHPTSPHAEEAWWQRALLLESVEGYDDYLDQYPAGRYAAQAITAMKQLDEAVQWRNAQRLDTISAYAEFLAKYPNGAYSELARKRKEELRKKPATETSPPATSPERGATSSKPAQRDLDVEEYDMALIPAGTFQMGSNDGESDEKPVHSVTVSSFYLGKYEVTVRQFKEFIDASGYTTDAEKDGGSNFWNGKEWEKKRGTNWKHDAEGNLRPSSEYNHPVIHVSWNDATEYCKWLAQKTGKPYRLPTEAEWEYAAGNGAKHTKYSWGNGNPSGKQGGSVADESGATKFNWTKSAENIFLGYNDGFPTTAPVGSFNANEFGLFDMTGNVWEWCQDWYGSDYYANSPSSNPQGPSTGSYRVLRGGSWGSDPQNCRVAYRVSDNPGDRHGGTGFRLARTF